MRFLTLITILNLTGIALLVSCDSPRVHQKGDTNGNITQKKGATHGNTPGENETKKISWSLEGDDHINVGIFSASNDVGKASFINFIRDLERSTDRPYVYNSEGPAEERSDDRHPLYFIMKKEQNVDKNVKLWRVNTEQLTDASYHTGVYKVDLAVVILGKENRSDNYPLLSDLKKKKIPTLVVMNKMDDFHADDDLEEDMSNDMRYARTLILDKEMKIHAKDLDPANIEFFCTSFKRIQKKFTNKYENDNLKQAFNNWLTQL